MNRTWLSALGFVLLILTPLLARADPAARVQAALDNVLTLPRAGQDGYATVWDGDKYVQCGRASSGGLRCEAAGTLMQPSLAHVLTPDRAARLAALGWKLDPRFGNYVQVFPAKVPTGQVADAILRTLLEAYGADLSQLEAQTAWLASEPCPPRNGPTQNLAGMISDAAAMAPFSVHACAYVPGPAGPPPVDTADALVARYGARVTAELQRLRVNLKSYDYVAFETDIGYIQCAAEVEPDRIYCEAQSAESWPALGSILTPERIARLHGAGYADPGRAPNYSKGYPLGSFDDAAIAREILTLLHDVYGYNGAQPLKYATEAGDEK